MALDVFISYRRDRDAQTARLFRAELEMLGFEVFLDVDDLRPGQFDEALIERIQDAPNFLVILSPGSLDRCSEPGDWLRREIVCAMASQKTIIPIMMPGFGFPEEQDLPQDLQPIRVHHGVTYSHEYFQATLNKVVGYLGAPRNPVRHGRALDGGVSKEKRAMPTMPLYKTAGEPKQPSPSQGIADIQTGLADVDESGGRPIVPGEQGDYGERPLYGLARRVALFGPKALINELPCARFGKLIAVGRGEVESLRDLGDLIKNYEETPRPARPLSLAAFGPSGSGQSFAVKQIAKAVLGFGAPILEFDLSLFSDPGELVGTFHQVRDKVVEGTTPVVVWGEFDAHDYRWLPHLLAPMQDGKFREGQVAHPLGKCLFVFVGGTSYDFANFSPRKDARPGDHEEGADSDKGQSRFGKFKLAKGPDFVSRLDGYLNVAGPNRRQKFDTALGEWVDDDSPRDLLFPVRRALFMRLAGGFGGATEGKEMDVDDGLLTALLEISAYEHGARSIETIMRFLESTGNLPPEDQLSLHVDYDEFMCLVDRYRPFEMNSEALAPAVHEHFRRLCRENNWPTPFDVDYGELPDGVKADNIAAAARIPRVLAQGGLVVVTESQPNGPSRADVMRILENEMEFLAEVEHDGWMEQKYRDGWSYGPVRDDSRKMHPCLVQYAAMSEEDKEKDRNAVRHYPDIVELAGFGIANAGAPIDPRERRDG